MYRFKHTLISGALSSWLAALISSIASSTTLCPGKQFTTLFKAAETPRATCKKKGSNYNIEK